MHDILPTPPQPEPFKPEPLGSFLNQVRAAHLCAFAREQDGGRGAVAYELAA